MEFDFLLYYRYIMSIGIGIVSSANGTFLLHCHGDSSSRAVVHSETVTTDFF